MSTRLALHLAPCFLLLCPLAFAQSTPPGPSSTTVSAPAHARTDVARVATTPWREVHYGNPHKLKLRSETGLVLDEREGALLYQRGIDAPKPVASLTKLLTVLVLLEARLDPEEHIRILRADHEQARRSRSRLPVGTVLRRDDLMKVAFVASDNRAAVALGRTFPGGTKALLERMNARARQIGMTRSRFSEPSGLDAANISTARDLALLAQTAGRHPQLSTWSKVANFRVINQRDGRPLEFRNSNGLVHRPHWHLELSKTGFTSDAGYCMLFRTTIADRPVTVVLLRSWGSKTKYGDSARIRDWMRKTEGLPVRVGLATVTGPGQG